MLPKCLAVPEENQTAQVKRGHGGLPEIKYSTATVSTAFITHLRAGSQEHFTAPVCAVCKAPVIVNGPIKLTLMSTFVDTKLRSRGN